MEYLSQILIDVGHNKEYAMRLSWAVSLWDDDVKKLGRKDIIFHLTELPQNSNFSVHSFAGVDIVESALDVFDGNCFVFGFLICFYHLAETALALDFLEFKIITEALPSWGKILCWFDCLSVHLLLG